MNFASFGPKPKATAPAATPLTATAAATLPPAAAAPAAEAPAAAAAGQAVDLDNAPNVTAEQPGVSAAAADRPTEVHIISQEGAQAAGEAAAAAIVAAATDAAAVTSAGADRVDQATGEILDGGPAALPAFSMHVVVGHSHNSFAQIMRGLCGKADVTQVDDPLYGPQSKTSFTMDPMYSKVSYLLSLNGELPNDAGPGGLQLAEIRANTQEELDALKFNLLLSQGSRWAGMYAGMLHGLSDNDPMNRMLKNEMNSVDAGVKRAVGESGLQSYFVPASCSISRQSTDLNVAALVNPGTPFDVNSLITQHMNSLAVLPGVAVSAESPTPADLPDDLRGDAGGNAIASGVVEILATSPEQAAAVFGHMMDLHRSLGGVIPKLIPTSYGNVQVDTDTHFDDDDDDNDDYDRHR